MTTRSPFVSPSDLVDLSRWDFIDSGPLSAEENMAVDQSLLDDMERGSRTKPVLRFFDWNEPAVTFGYLLDPEKVKTWAAPYQPASLIKRPTGGGAVYHSPGDWTVSLLFLKTNPDFPRHPRALYQAIHEKIHAALVRHFNGPDFFIKPENSCEEKKKPGAQGRFSSCFQEPVCNDLMLKGRKILGGALRVARKSILYQGSLQLPQEK